MPASTSHQEAGMLRRSVYSILPILAIFVVQIPHAFARQVIDYSSGAPQSVNFSLSKIFTFLFLTLGPLKLLAPFHAMTRGCNADQSKSLAYKSTVIALIAIILASVSGANILHKWGISIGALLLTAGLVLFLVALKPILEQFAHISPQPPPSSDVPIPSPMQLAFPTIVTPYGIAILIVLVSLHTDNTAFLQILGVAVFILLLDLIAMLYADRILKTPLVAIALGIVGAVMGVLQVALGVSACVAALRLLGMVKS